MSETVNVREGEGNFFIFKINLITLKNTVRNNQAPSPGAWGNIPPFEIQNYISLNHL